MVPSDFTRRMRKNPLSVAGFSLIVFFVAVAILAPILAPPPATSRNAYLIPQEGFASDPRPPAPGRPFGTTEGQYDLYYGIVWGTRTAFRVSVTVIAISVAVGLVLGGISGYYGGRLDEVIMRITDVFLAFPGLVLAVVVVAVLGRSLDNVMIAIAMVNWPTYARLLRGDILGVRSRDFVEAARAMGASDVRIIFRHIIPNAIYPFLVFGSLDVGLIVLTAAALSFLGLGAEVGYADWGMLINLSRNWILGAPGNPLAYWYVVVFPGAAIFLFVLGWNLLGDAFRDILDPRLRGAS
ncbi:MAG: ABC transporter permease [Armatimonadota bacterium]|nr:ABC transporter permease [Armatimonadota bacterium]MDR7452074.1 ABC transporter permease [Armatimonadota bacterium]MDR7466536.1 ABC transporter permease [Armatimonadota bacterium]MDR7493258.1 ABC transporter permease [Armatimonadota bacterium]MDR7499849.1 ABC transporter permease [Armatimonadota bacterium]